MEDGNVKARNHALLAAAALLAVGACSKSGEKTVDTTTVPGKDTVSTKMAVPTTDTVVKTTTTTVDTTKGKVNQDSAKADSAKKGQHHKGTTKKK